MRSGNRLERVLCLEGLSRTFAPYPLQGSRVAKELGLPDQQHSLAAVDHRGALQKPLASGDLF